MKKHTPGKWAITNKDTVTAQATTERPYSVVVAECTGYAAQRHANARLIAAAPRMFDALAYVVNWHRQHDSGEGELFGLDYVTACINALRDADPDWHTTRVED